MKAKQRVAASQAVQRDDLRWLRSKFRCTPSSCSGTSPQRTGNPAGVHDLAPVGLQYPRPHPGRCGVSEVRHLVDRSAEPACRGGSMTRIIIVVLPLFAAVSACQHPGCVEADRLARQCGERGHCAELRQAQQRACADDTGDGEADSFGGSPDSLLALAPARKDAP